MMPEDRALTGLEGDHEPHAPTILGHVAEPELTNGLGAVRRAVPVEMISVDPDSPGLDRPDAGQCLQQLGLTVARDARDSDDLSGPYRKSDVAERTGRSVFQTSTSLRPRRFR